MSPSGSELLSWGDNGQGQLGLGNRVQWWEETGQKYSPTKVGSDQNWRQLTAADNYSLAIKTDGTLWAWGYNYHGYLGLGDNQNRLTPTQVGTDRNWQQVSARQSQILAIKTDGTLWAWGYNYHGYLGLGDNQNRLTPTQVGTDRNWQQVSAGKFHSLALKTDGSLWAWGGNFSGELGLGDYKDRLTPTQVGTDHNWQQISAGYGSSQAIKTDGTLWAWGLNKKGELGLGDNQNRLIPTRVGTDQNWQRVTNNAGGTSALGFTLAIKTDGTLWAWGYGDYGSLGLGDYKDRLTPTQVGADRNWQQVAVGGYAGVVGHSLAIKTDGTLWAWGDNHSGLLGLGNNTTSPLKPIQVGLDKGWQQVSSNSTHTLAIKMAGTPTPPPSTDTTFLQSEVERYRSAYLKQKVYTDNLRIGTQRYKTAYEKLKIELAKCQAQASVEELNFDLASVNEGLVAGEKTFQLASLTLEEAKSEVDRYRSAYLKQKVYTDNLRIGTQRYKTAYEKLKIELAKCQ